MSQLISALKSADESYLCALANKGLYKRAVRELPETEIKTEIADDAVKAVFADGTEVVLENEIQNYSCSCPSRSICKHVLMVVLAVQGKDAKAAEGEQAAEEATPPEKAAEDGFAYLLDTEAQQLRKLAGKRNYQKAVLGLELLGEVEILEESTLKIRFLRQGVQVHFLPRSSLQTATCSCKAAGFCIHKASAVLQYIEAKNGALPEGFQLAREETALEFKTNTIPVIAEFVESIFAAGLVRLGEDVAGRFGQIAVICHSQRLADMERLCNRIEGRFQRYYSRSAAFDQAGLIDDLCHMSSLCRALASDAPDPSAAGVFREQYLPVASLSLHGLGALGWHTQSGYTGVTVYFYDGDGKRMLEYSSVMPDGSVKTTPQKLFNGSAPWGIPTHLSAVAHSKLVLSQARVSRKLQLSASSETTARVEGPADLLGDELAEIQYTDFKEVTALLWERMQEEESWPVAVLVPASFGKPVFDQVEQELTIPVYDSRKRKLMLVVKHEESSRLTIENLQRLAAEKKLTGPVLAKIQMKQGQLTASPITLFEREGALDLSLQEERAGTGSKKHRFNWET